MKLNFLFAALIFLVVDHVSAFQQPAPTTILLVRHAEKTDDSTADPPLTAEGQQRAENLATVLVNNFEIAAIYSTGYKRTKMTANPLADRMDLDVQEYGFDDAEGWLTTIVSDYSGETVLIVGHSNTTPMLINLLLGEQTLDQLDEKAYGDLFIVTATAMGEATLELSKF